MKTLNLKIHLYFLGIAFSTFVMGQSDIYQATSSKVSFTSDAPLELIQASSDKMRGFLNLLDKSYAFQVKMNTFEGFNSAMQKTHFNENYIESEKYPNATFTGKIIEDIDFSKPGVYDVRGKGKFTVHGVEQVRIVKCKLTIKPDGISISSDFSVFLDEHNIKIPSVVNQKIAEEILVKIQITLKPSQF